MPQSSPPSTNTIKEATENLSGFTQWLAELIQKRNWFKLLLLIDVGLFFGFKQQGGIVIHFLQQYFSLNLPGWYSEVFWLVLAGLFLVAIAIAIKTMPQTKQLEIKEGEARRAVKGLRSFTADDKEIFTKLQREGDIQNCLDSLSRKEFRFGILTGESGCGKTSLLQAGILPKLNQENSSYQGIYVRFSDHTPLATIRDAIFEYLDPPDNWREKVSKENLLVLLRESQHLAQKPLVLIFDQFEQFFTSRRRAEERKPFITELANWYKQGHHIPVKILISIREDLLGEHCTLQQAMKYTLSLYNHFRLEKFEHKQAAEILQVIAATEGWEFDQNFVTKLVDEELGAAGSKISPIDLQILAETVRKQPTEQQALKEETFRKMDGLEGLLNRYLEKLFDTLEIQTFHQAGVQVLLALINREQNVRAGKLTLEQIQEKLQGTVSPLQVSQATAWLASGEVRLISPVEQQGQTGYELTHERIIPAVLQFAGQTLESAAKANQLLEHRVNEWLGNSRSSRYLFSWSELWLLRQQKKHVVWGKNQRAKESLIRRSWQRFYRAGWAVLVTLILLSASFLVWLSPPGQIWQMQWELARLSKNLTNDEARTKIAIAFAKVGNQEHASEIAESISGSFDKVKVLSAIAMNYSQLQNTDEALKVLAQATTSIESFPVSLEKAQTLSAIAMNYSQLQNTDEALKVLAQATTSIESFPVSLEKAQTLSVIVAVYGQLQDTNEVLEALAQFRTSIMSLPDSYEKARILSAIAAAYGQLQDTDEALKALAQASNSVVSIPEFDKAQTLSAIAAAYGQLQDTDEVLEALDQFHTSIESLPDSYEKNKILIAIAAAYGQLQKNNTALEVLKQAHTSIESLSPAQKAWVLSTIATNYDQLQETDEALRILAKARTSIESLSPAQKARVLSTIAKAYGQLQNTDEALKALEQLRTSAESLPVYEEIRALSVIAAAQANFQAWRQVHITADTCNSEECESSVLSAGLTVWAEHRHPELQEEDPADL